MADSPEVRRGTGGDPTSPPLPQGEAERLNEPDIPVEDEAAALALEPEGGEFDEDTTDTLALLSNQGLFNAEEMEGFTPKTPEDAILYAPSGDRAAFRQRARGRPLPTPPENMGAWLPALAAASRDPAAPPGVRALFETIMDALYPPNE